MKTAGGETQFVAVDANVWEFVKRRHAPLGVSLPALLHAVVFELSSCTSNTQQHISVTGFCSVVMMMGRSYHGFAKPSLAEPSLVVLQ